MQPLAVAAIQQNGYANKTQALNQTMDNIRIAASKGAKLILLQELFNTLYFCQTENVEFFNLAEPIPGPTTGLLAELAKELNVVIVASLFEKRAAGLFHNTAVVLDVNGQIAGRYRKMHIPHDPGFNEKYYFTPGDLGFTPITTSVGKLGVLVCWDQWYPEAARLMALAGAEILLYPTAIGWGHEDSASEVRRRQMDAWMTIQRSHAIANHLPVMVANRVGMEKNPNDMNKGIKFWGNSFISDAQGEIVARASASDPEILMHTLDLAQTNELRELWPFLRDRRVDAYTGLLRRFLD